MTRAQLRVAARGILRAGLAAVEPGQLIRKHLRIAGAGFVVGRVSVAHPSRVFVVAVGKTLSFAERGLL